jgi:hypothetical protein
MLMPHTRCSLVLIVDRRFEVFRREEQVKGELRKFPQVDAPSDRS